MLFFSWNRHKNTRNHAVHHAQTHTHTQTDRVMGTVVLEALYPYNYTDDDGSDISFQEGDRFLLIEKSNADWWKVQRTGVFSGRFHSLV